VRLAPDLFAIAEHPLVDEFGHQKIGHHRVGAMAEDGWLRPPEVDVPRFPTEACFVELAMLG
jgi:hypothetical protein